MRRATRALLTAVFISPVVLTGLAGCASLPSGPPDAVARLRPTGGSQVAGVVSFTQDGSRVLVRAEVTGLRPNHEHAFHIHEKGDCSAADGMSAGGHFNPLHKPHGHPATSERHAGDLLALRADSEGRAALSAEFDTITLSTGPTAILGRAVVVHAQPDDYRTQPGGNAGARLACGVIKQN